MTEQQIESKVNSVNQKLKQLKKDSYDLRVEQLMLWHQLDSGLYEKKFAKKQIRNILKSME